MWRDPIVDEIHQIRDEYARRFNYDLHAICEDIRARQASSGRKIVSRETQKRPVIVNALDTASCDRD